METREERPSFPLLIQHQKSLEILIISANILKSPSRISSHCSQFRYLNQFFIISSLTKTKMNSIFLQILLGFTYKVMIM